MIKIQLLKNQKIILSALALLVFSYLAGTVIGEAFYYYFH